MAGLLSWVNDKWSSADWWDKEENKKQREEFARQEQRPAPVPRPQVQARPVAQSQPQRQDSGGFSFTNNPLTRGFSRSFDQINPFDNGRTWQQRTPTKAPASVLHQATHNGATNLVGDAVVKPLVRTSMAINQGVGNAQVGIAHTLGLRRDLKTQNAQEYAKNTGIPDLQRFSDYKGTKRQITGDLITNVSNIAFPGSSKVVTGAVSKVLPKAVPKVIPKAVSGAVVGAPTGAVSNVGAYVSSDAPLSRQGVVRAAKEGAIFGAAGGAALPIAGAAVQAGARAATPVIRQGTQNAIQSAKVAKRNFDIANTPKVMNMHPNERYALSDFADYQMGLYKPQNAAVTNQLFREARAAAQKAGVNITGSPAQIRDNIASFLESYDNAARRVRQGGYIRNQQFGQGDRTNIQRELADAIVKGSNEPVYFGELNKQKFDRINELRLNNGLEPLDSPSVHVYPSVLQKLKAKRVDVDNLTPEQVADIAYSALHNSKSRVIGSKYPQVQATVKPKENLSNIAYIGKHPPTTGGASLKSTYKIPNARLQKSTHSKVASNAGRPVKGTEVSIPQTSPVVNATGKIAPPQKNLEPLQTSPQQSNNSPAVGERASSEQLKEVPPQPHQPVEQRPKPKQVKQSSFDDSVAQREQRVFEQNPMAPENTKTFDLDDNGQLIENKAGQGAYKLHLDDDGKVLQFRVGDEVFDAKDLGDLSDVNGYGSIFATMRRNIERGFGKETGEKVNKFLVDHQQAQATKLIERRLEINKGMKQVADDLGISFGVGRGKAKKVSAAIQKYGEGNLTKEQLVDQFGKEMAGKIVKADKWFRGMYDNLLDEMNDVLTKYGYDPVPKRKDYYTHFQEPSLWEKFGLKMQEIRDLTSPTMQDANPAAGRGKISNKLAGQSEYLQPNKQFNPFALKRTGETHTDDAFGAFEKYLTPTLNNIYMTPSITRARVLSKAVAQEADVAGRDANKMIIQMREWANHLAGKSNRWGDRQLADSMTGSKYLKFAQWAQRQAGANSIVGNIGTAAIQPIVLAQTTGKNGVKNTILAAMQELSTAHAKDAAIRQSEFMRRRYANIMPVTATKRDRLSRVANKPLEVVEETVARITWNAAHNEALSKNLTGKAAIRYADVQAEKTLAGRSIGERPELFTAKAMGPATMYQLEVNNYWQQFKEMNTPQKLRTFAAAYVIGVGMQQLLGRDVGFNPLDAAIDSFKEATNPENSTGEKVKKVAQRLGGEVADNVPVIPAVAGALVGDDKLKDILGPDSNVGRFGVSSPIRALFSTTNVGGVPVPLNAVLPFGGGQIKKTVDAAQTLSQGGIEDKNGKQKVAVDGSPVDHAKGLLFGKSSIPEVNEYYEGIGKKKTSKPGEELSTSERIKQAFTTEEGKAMLALDNDQQREEQYPELYREYKAMKKAFDTSFSKPANYSRLDGSVQAHYAAQAGLTSNGKKSWERRQATGESKKLADSVNKMRPSGFPAVPATNKVASLYADFASKKEAEKWSPTRENQEMKSLLRESYKTSLNDNDKYWLNANDGLFEQAIEAGDIGPETLSRLVAYDDLQVQLGGSQKIGKKLRGRLGLSQPPGVGGSGGGSKAAPNLSSVLSTLSSARAAIKPPQMPKSMQTTAPKQQPKLNFQIKRYTPQQKPKAGTHISVRKGR